MEVVVVWRRWWLCEGDGGCVKEVVVAWRWWLCGDRGCVEEVVAV